MKVEKISDKKIKVTTEIETIYDKDDLLREKHEHENMLQYETSRFQQRISEIDDLLKEFK